MMRTGYNVPLSGSSTRCTHTYSCIIHVKSHPLVVLQAQEPPVLANANAVQSLSSITNYQLNYKEVCVGVFVLVCGCVVLTLPHSLFTIKAESYMLGCQEVDVPLIKSPSTQTCNQWLVCEQLSVKIAAI